MVKKVIKIHTNDPGYRVFSVSMSGEVRPIARLTPEIVSLRGKPGEKVSVAVKIIPAAVPDFEITSAQAKVGRDIDFTIEKQGTPPDNYFLLTVNNIKQGAGRYFDIIVLETDTIPKRDIQVRVSGHLQP
jgi:hypothetical protein